MNQPAKDNRPDRYLKVRDDGPIQARFSIPIPFPYVSERITVPLGTKDMDEARARRDCIEQALDITCRKVQAHWR